MQTQPFVDRTYMNGPNIVPRPVCRLVDPIDPDWEQRRTIAASSLADIDLCWACGACDNGCPVSMATGRLHPQHTVRMAVFGMLDELLCLPDIWYCLLCRRCLQGCPNRVKPYELHRYLQAEAIARGFFPAKFIAAYRKLISDFQRVRWKATAHCFKYELNTIDNSTWYRWLRSPLRKPVYNPIFLGHRPEIPGGDPGAQFPQGRSCVTCSECSGCCPIMSDGDVFDPQRIIRQANLGLAANLLASPAIWLCLGCKRCAEACSQAASGYAVIQQLQQRALDTHIVDAGFQIRLRAADRIIYPKFLDEIDTLLGLFRQRHEHP
jgi:heterodisulfide reductase subunit C